MSMIALTDRLRAGRLMARSVLLVIAVTAAVIVGLLAMHSFNSHTGSDTGNSAAVSSAASTGAESSAANTGVVKDHHAGLVAADEPCADCGAGGHSDVLTMACVLALLATVLLVARVGGQLRWLSGLPRPKLLSPRSSHRPRTRPPSLTALCISRT